VGGGGGGGALRAVCPNKPARIELVGKILQFLTGNVESLAKN